MCDMEGLEAKSSLRWFVMSSDVVKRRPTRQVERLLKIMEDSYFSLLRSQKYAQASQARNAGRFVQNLREIEIAYWSSIAIIHWVLGIGLTDIERERILKELEIELDA